jgi:hypothetical protein
MRTQVLLKRLDDLRNTLFPDDPVVALAESDVILKAVRAAGAANEWRCVGVAFDCMDNILQRTVHQSDPELILQNAYTTMAATAAAAEAGEWTQLETRLARLQSLCAQQSLCDSGDIAQALVASLCLTLLCAGAATQWVCVQTALTCLDSLRSHPSLQYDATMAKCEVDVAVTIIEHAAKSGHWTWVEHMEHRSTKLALSFRDRGVLVMLAGAHAMVSGYSQRRYHGLEPNESQSAAAAGAAGFITDCASAPDSHHELTELALQVIQDSHSRFPQTDTIARVYRRCRERGFNFTPAPWDVVRDPR